MMADTDQVEETSRIPKRVQLVLYGLLCLAVALVIFFLQVESRVVLLFVFGLLFLVAMLFDQRGVMHSVPAGRYSIQALFIYLGMVGLLVVLFLGNYLLARFGAVDFFDRMEAAVRLSVFIYHLPLLLLAGLLVGVALFGYWVTTRRRNFPHFVSVLMDRSFLLFVVLGLILASTSVEDGLHAALAPLITGDPDVLEGQMIYEHFVLLDAQLDQVRGYALQVQQDAAGTPAGEIFCVELPGPYWSSEGLQARAFPPDTLRLVDEPALLLESWQVALDGITRYEQLGEAMLRDSSAYESTLPTSESYLVCGKKTTSVVAEIDASLERLEEARRALDTWIEANLRQPASQAQAEPQSHAGRDV
ncbi:MAG: hypothetical protein PVF47_10600 [Anaerolineae bacterium]|jgi:hypothetical protein